MLLTTTNTIEGKEITQYFGIVSGETIIGANVFKDFFAGIRDIVRRTRRFLRKRITRSKRNRLKRNERSCDTTAANAVIAIDLDYRNSWGKWKYANGYCRRDCCTLSIIPKMKYSL